MLPSPSSGFRGFASILGAICGEIGRPREPSLPPLPTAMKILLTGFEPFARVRVNPSQKIVEALAQDRRPPRAAELIVEVLPTEFRAAGRRIRALLRHVRPDAVVCLGVAASRTAISLERVALNLDDDALPDNAGLRLGGRPIARHGPPAYWSTLPLARLHKALQARGIPSAISNHAGTFVCNHVFYLARHEVERLGNRAPCGFIHVPALSRKGGKSGLPLNRMTEAITCCLGVLAGRNRWGAAR